MRNRIKLSCFIVLIISCGFCHAFTDYYIGELKAVDLPEGFCAGHAPTGIRWTAPENTTVDISGHVWKIRNSSDVGVTLWIKGQKVLARGIVPAQSIDCNSKKPKILADLLTEKGGKPSLLKNISMKKGDEIVLYMEGNDYMAVELNIKGGGKTWDFAKDFSYENNPNGAWAFGGVTVDENDLPQLTLLDRVEKYFDRNARMSKDLRAWKGEGSAMMFKSIGDIPIFRDYGFVSGKTVYTEAMYQDRWIGRCWAADGTQKLEYEGFMSDAFEIEIDNEKLTGWKFKGIEELPGSNADSKHLVVNLQNTGQDIAVKVHTALDGTAIIKRWLEITNHTEKPLPLTAVHPWTTTLYNNVALGGYMTPPKEKAEVPFVLGYYTRQKHYWEGSFEWKEFEMDETFGTLCEFGQCYGKPFFIVQSRGTGTHLIGHLSWSANWEMEFDFKDKRYGHFLDIKAGPWASTALRVIDSGETIETPAIHMGMVAGDLNETVQAMHSHIRRSVNLPLESKYRYLAQYSQPGDQGYFIASFGDNSRYTEESVRRNIDIAAAIGSELYIMDAGWWENRGDWDVAAFSRFPNELKPLVDYCHSKGMLFGLYGEFEKANPGSRIHTEHPEWFDWYPYEVINLGAPGAAEYVENEICKMVDKYGIDLLRLDFNTPKDERTEGIPNIRHGIEENNFWRYYDGFRQVFENINKKYPNLVLQQAACGGGRNDLGTVPSFHENYLTDCLRLPYQIQNYAGQSLALPPENFLIAHGANAGGGNGHPENLDTNLRIAYTLATPWLFSGAVAPSMDAMPPERIERFLHYDKIYKEFIRPIFPTCKMYQHDPVTANTGVWDSDWFAMEYASPDGSKGWATIIRVGDSETDTYLFKPKGLRYGKTYRVTVDSLDDSFIAEGLTLMRDGLPARLGVLCQSELFLFEEVQ